MRLQRGRSLFEKQLDAEVRRILALLERIRRTRRRARVLIALESASRRKMGIKSDGVRRLVSYRPRLAGPRLRRRAD
jgi:hypothetical protein